jgi:hypothetical protein
MNAWAALASIVSSLALLVFLLLFFCGDTVVDLVDAWKQKTRK